MKPADNINNLFEKSKITVGNDVDEKILNKALNALPPQAPEPDRHIWSIIMMNTRPRKFKIAVVSAILIIIAGLTPINETTVFGKITDEVSATLVRLKALVLGEKTSNTKHVKHQIDESIKIHTRSTVYSIKESTSIESFLEKHGILLLSGKSNTIKYAIIPSDRITILKEFFASLEECKVLTNPSVLQYCGSEAMVAAVGIAGIAITPHQDENNQLFFDFAFHNAQNGCSIEGIYLKNGEALLITNIKDGSEKIMSVLIRPEAR